MGATTMRSVADSSTSDSYEFKLYSPGGGSVPDLRRPTSDWRAEATCQVAAAAAAAPCGMRAPPPEGQRCRRARGLRGLPVVVT
jgi:hypothetical protein